jgi:pilus assembly protein Flp/PilA
MPGGLGRIRRDVVNNRENIVPDFKVRNAQERSEMHRLIHALRCDEKGAALVEYGLLVGLIAVICVAAVTLLGQDVSSAFSAIAAQLSAI